MDLRTLNYISVYIDKALELLMEDLDSPRSYHEHAILIKVEEARMWVQEAELFRRMENDLDHEDT